MIVNNNAGNGEIGLSELIRAGRVRKVICSFARSSNPRKPNAAAFAEFYRAGKIELECVPQGTLAERLRAAGSGMGPFFTPYSNHIFCRIDPDGIRLFHDFPSYQIDE